MRCLNLLKNVSGPLDDNGITKSACQQPSHQQAQQQSPSASPNLAQHSQQSQQPGSATPTLATANSHGPLSTQTLPHSTPLYSDLPQITLNGPTQGKNKLPIFAYQNLSPRKNAES